SFSVFWTADCSGPGPAAGSEWVRSTDACTSDPVQENVAGAYRWTAAYSGDANNNPVSTACNDTGETSTVGAASPTMTTSATNARAGGRRGGTEARAGGTAATGKKSSGAFAAAAV